MTAAEDRVAVAPRRAQGLRLRGNRVVALRQYTDTARWGEPNEPSA